MYTYYQSTGVLTRNGVIVGIGHSGNGDGRNNPKMQDVHNVGPLPRGHYKIGAWQPFHEHLGPIVAPLIPQPDDAGSLAWLLGRGGFYIHGPELSEGCIVQDRPVRQSMMTSGDDDLEVVDAPPNEVD